jgi:hypothetical protein
MQQQQAEEEDGAGGDNGLAGSSRNGAARAASAAALSAVAQQQQQQQQQEQQHDEQEESAGTSAGDGAAASGSIEQQLLAALLVLEQLATALPWAYMSALGREVLLQLALPLAEVAPQAAGEAGTLQVQQLWDFFIAAAKPLAAGVMQLAEDVQLQLAACAVVGLQQLSDDTEACSMIMQLLESLTRLATVVAKIQPDSAAVPCSTGWQFSPGALSSRMASDCNEIHAVLAGYTARLLQLSTAAMPLPEAELRTQAHSWGALAAAASELEPAARQCVQLLDNLAGIKYTLEEEFSKVSSSARQLQQ